MPVPPSHSTLMPPRCCPASASTTLFPIFAGLHCRDHPGAGAPVDAQIGLDQSGLSGDRHGYGESGAKGFHSSAETGDWRASLDSFFSSVASSARSKTATPPIQPVKPTLRLLWMTRPIVKGPPLESSLGV